MQQAAGQAIAERHNVLLLSPTGSGKTLAFLLPLLQSINPDAQLQAIVVCPSRELAQQIDSVFRDTVRAAGLPLRAVALYGGRPTMDEHRVLREVQPHIVFATPGRLLDHIGKSNLHLHGVRTLVVDEYDKCLELGFAEQMEAIDHALAQTPQRVLTSATRATTDSPWLSRRKFLTIDYLDDHDDLAARLDVSIVPSPEKDKLQTLARLLSHLGDEQTIVFVAHREGAERVGKFLAAERFSAVVYHGGMEQDRRERALYRFRAGAANVLVSTDLAARGLDILAVRHIVHYHLPADAPTFTHRNGRTARWDGTGNAYLILGPEETLPDFIDSETAVFDVSAEPLRPAPSQWTLFYIGRGKRDKLSRADILGFLCKKGGLTAAHIGRIDVTPHASYVAIRPSCINSLLRRIAGEKIKGMRTIIEPVKH